MKFKLKDQTALQVSDHGQFYARALRAIGQDLSPLFPQCLEITAEAMTFEVAGRYVPRDAGEKAKDIDLLGRLRKKLSGGSSAAAPTESPAGLVAFSRTYTPADIDRLDELHSNQRGNGNATPDIYSLGEVLRMVGRIIDSDGKRLHKLSRDSYGVRFEYEDAAGATHKNELSSLQLYKLQQQYYGERGTFVPIDRWDTL